MKVLVVGGAGFLGGRIAAYLCQLGHEVRIGSRRKLQNLSDAPNSEVVFLDWDEPSSLSKACKGIDTVIHAAGMNAQDCAADPAGAFLSNTIHTARLVSESVKASVQRFMYLSTAHVYASPLEGTISENTCPRNLHPYATSHLAGEYAVLREHELGTIDGVVFRLTNAFGAPIDKEVNCWTLLVNDICRQAVERKQIILRTDGLQLRDFITISDVCQTLALFAKQVSTKKIGGIYNLGSGSSRSVLDMATLVQARCSEVLDFSPTLMAAQSNGQRPSALTYQIEKLSKLGLNVEQEKAAVEIDHLLLFCKNQFTEGSNRHD
jgi:UDP-glucose 4-epimerase